MHLRHLVNLAPCLLVAAGFAETPAYGPNLYWPGNFEARFEGGNFGSATNCRITADATGNKSWEAAPGYQHLELLVPSFRAGIVRFRALSPHAQTFTVQVVDPLPPGQATAEKKTRVVPHSIELKASPEWQTYEVPYVSLGSWPAPPVSEILLTVFNESSASVRIDDLEVRTLPDPTPPVVGREIAPPLANPAAFENLVLGSRQHPDRPASWAHQALDVSALRGQRVRISADVTYLSLAGDIQPWGAVLLVVSRGAEPPGEPLKPEGSWPFWLPIGHAAPPGEARRITADYVFPADAGPYVFSAQIQDGLGSNLVRLSGLRFEVLTPSDPK